MNINIDFQVYDSRDPKEFIVIDTSKWEHLSKKTAIIEITIPGESKPVVNYYDKGVNIFNSQMLYLNCDSCDKSFEDLPDGIYVITVKGSPDKFNKSINYLRTTKTRLELDDIYAVLDSEYIKSDSSIREIVTKLNEIEFLLRSAEANTRKGNNHTAQELFFKAQKIINKTAKCKNCK